MFNKKDLFIILYDKKVEKFKKDFYVYRDFIDKKYKRRKSYRSVMRSFDLLENHLNSVDVYRAYNRRINFDSALIEWTAKLNFLTGQALPNGYCMKMVYRHVEDINNLVCGYFE